LADLCLPHPGGFHYRELLSPKKRGSDNSLQLGKALR
jgi:hypothetical protein